MAVSARASIVELLAMLLIKSIISLLWHLHLILFISRLGVTLLDPLTVVHSRLILYVYRMQMAVFTPFARVHFE